MSDEAKMAETPWTKGPWSFFHYTCMDECWEDPAELERNRARCPDYWGVKLGDNPAHVTAHMGEANARLIAAAPMLYEALEAMVEIFNAYQGSEITQARAALARARGDE